MRSFAGILPSDWIYINIETSRRDVSTETKLLENNRDASDTPGAGEAPDLHGGATRQRAAAAGAEAELSRGGGADHLGGSGGDSRRKTGCGADGDGEKNSLPRRRHGRGAGDDPGDPGRGNLPRRDQAGDDSRSNFLNNVIRESLFVKRKTQRQRTTASYLTIND